MDGAAADLQREMEYLGHHVLRTDNSNVILTNRPELVHFHGLWNPIQYLRQLMLYRNIPIVISTHGMLEPWAFRYKRLRKWFMFHFIEKQRLRRAYGVLATSDQEARNIDKIVGRKVCTTIPLGIRLPNKNYSFNLSRNKLNWAHDEVVLLYLGRIHPIKGLFELVRGISLLNIDLISTISLRLVFVGEGECSYFDRVKQVADLLSPSIRVDWKGPIWGDDKWDFYAGADLLCLPSYSENFGIVAIEAASLGTPVLSTKYTPWAFVDYEHFGPVVEPTEESIRVGLEKFLKEIAIWRSTREQRASWTIDKYGWTAVVQEYEKFYSSIIEKNKKRKKY